jgi:hypothetical protein
MAWIFAPVLDLPLNDGKAAVAVTQRWHLGASIWPNCSPRFIDLLRRDA